MKSIFFLFILLPLLTFAQDTTHVIHLNINHSYRRMMLSDSNNVTLLSIGEYNNTPVRFHIIDIKSGSIKSIVSPNVPSFQLKYSVSRLPNIQVGTISYPNFLFVGTRNDSTFLINTKFTPNLDFVEVLDIKYFPVGNRYAESTTAIMNPIDSKYYTFLSFFTGSGIYSDVHTLIKLLPNYQLEVTTVDSIESQKLTILHYIKDFSFLNGYYYLTGSNNNSLSAIVDSNLNIIDKENANRYDPMNFNTHFSLRGYVTRQLPNNRTVVIGDGYYGSEFPPIVKPTLQTVKVENGQIVFKDSSAFSILDRSTDGLEATYPSVSQPAIFIAGAEPKDPFEFFTSYIYFKKLVNGQEVLYKRYGDDYHYRVANIEVMENGNILICGNTANNGPGPILSEGFYLILDQDGNVLVSTNNITEAPQRLEIAPVPAFDKLFFKLDLAHDARLEVIDLFGRVVFTDKNIHSNYIDINGFSPGLYFLNIYNQSKRYSNKFIKME